MSYFFHSVILSWAILSMLSLWLSQAALGVECGNSLFTEDSLAVEVKNAKNRFQSLTRSFEPDEVEKSRILSSQDLASNQEISFVS